MAKLIAPEIEVRDARRIGVFTISLATASAVSGPVDHPPGNDDLLVGGGRPFEIGHRDLAVRAALQRLQEFLGDDRLRVALALDREFIHVHRIGDVDGKDQFDVDGRIGLPCRPVDGWRRSAGGPAGSPDSARQHPPRRRRPVRPRQARPRSRHTSALRPSRRMTAMVTCKLVAQSAKSFVLHIRVSRATATISRIRAVPDGIQNRASRPGIERNLPQAADGTGTATTALHGMMTADRR